MLSRNVAVTAGAVAAVGATMRSESSSTSKALIASGIAASWLMFQKYTKSFPFSCSSSSSSSSTFCCDNGTSASLTGDDWKRVLPELLAVIPQEWRGTTFKNNALLGREKFSANLIAMICTKQSKGEQITVEDMVSVGNAEDYLRVATNISTMLELVTAHIHNVQVANVFSFASSNMPIVAVSYTSNAPVHVYTNGAASPFTAEQMKIFELMQKKVFIHTSDTPSTKTDSNSVVLSLSTPSSSFPSVDAFVFDSFLVVKNASIVKPSDLLVVRKRMATPLTTPVAEARLQTIAGVPVTANSSAPSKEEDHKDFLLHLQRMSGADYPDALMPLVSTAGLPSLCSLLTGLAMHGGADLLMCSTAYGGASQLADVFTGLTGLLTKRTFGVQGGNDMNTAIHSALDEMAVDTQSLKPTTVLFIEAPTNPDMKVPNITNMVDTVKEYKKKTKRNVLLLVDTTFAPCSGIAQKFHQLWAQLPVIVFISLSKSVSRGITTSGAIVANDTVLAKDVLRKAHLASAFYGTTATTDQMNVLSREHIGVEDRCQKAFEVAQKVGDALVNAVKKTTGQDMVLAFVTEKHAKMGFTSSTFSFNLPGVKSQNVNEKMAQLFVDLLTEHKSFKPCVSFGQDNGLVYCTVPATSTQGAIKAEDKAKQAVGGVQLVRLSFPPPPDQSYVSQVSAHVENSVKALYSKVSNME